MKLFILGISGTFMAGIATLAKQAGFSVTGCDTQIYPPMSHLLQELDIPIYEGYEADYLIQTKPDMVIVGNALARGNPCIEVMLNAKLPFMSGPQWLAEYLLADRQVLAVAGTHGKTTTTAILTWILYANGYDPGYLIGGLATNFTQSAAKGSAPFFVLEADEYDTAFFDKRPKFIHYHPQVVIATNLEFDHADIYPDLAAIERQFHFLWRTVPAQGHIIVPAADTALARSMAQGHWSKVHFFGATIGEWQARPLNPEASKFAIYHHQVCLGEVSWPLFGNHNLLNALAAIIAAHQVGIAVSNSLAVLPRFQGVKRRLEKYGEVKGITIYDDFAHHPTAIAATLQALRQRVGQQRILAVIHFASNSMLKGVHIPGMAAALTAADWVICAKPPEVGWDLEDIIANSKSEIEVADDVEEIVKRICQMAQPQDHIIIMSNKAFAGIHQKLLTQLANL